jgi:glutathione S-transferase
MTLQLHYHPLASFCCKALIALYENDTPFESAIVDFADPASAAAFKAVWPLAKMPVLQDDARGKTVAESTVVIDYLDSLYPGRSRLLPLDPDGAWRTRMWDRVFDNYVQFPMQKIVADGFRPEGAADPFGVEQAKGQLYDIYPVIERELGSATWITGDDFTLADCAAAPALFYANIVAPVAGEHQRLTAYLKRLMARPSFARVLREAAPYFRMFPFESDLRARYPELDGGEN